MSVTEAGEYENTSSLWWWFTMNREEGGPVYHSRQNLKCPFFTWYSNTTISTLVFLFPLIVGLVLLPSFRKKHWSSMLVVVLCLLTGFLLTLVHGSSSWVVGEVAVNASVGPQKPPVQGRLGVWAGLWHVNLTYETEAFAFNERVDWSAKSDLVKAHKASLADGWPWPLVRLTEELGGEGLAWPGLLGDGLMQAGLAAYCLLVAAMAVWAVWVLLFIVSPPQTAHPLILSGIILEMCSLTYIVCVEVRLPRTFMVAGTKMILHMGYAWWVITSLGLCLALVGIGILFYSLHRPGQLTVIFEMDFGSPDHLLHHSQPLLAFKDKDDNYSQGYPWPRNVKGTNEHVREETVKEKQNLESEGKSFPKDSTSGADVANTHSNTCLGSDSSECPSREIQTKEPETDSINCSTLQQDESHTPPSLTPLTIRHRSPEQPQSRSSQESITPPTPLEMITETSSLNKYIAILKKMYSSQTSPPACTPKFKRSKLQSSLPPRLSYRSPLKMLSQSVSRLVNDSDVEQDAKEDSELNESNATKL